MTGRRTAPGWATGPAPWLTALVLAVGLAALRVPIARAAAEPSAEGGDGYDPGVLPGLAAIFPGVLLHGSGVWVAGDRDTALALLAAQGAGLATVIASGAVLWGTGASRHFSGASVGAVVLGGGLFLTPAVADLYGAVVGGTDFRAALRAPRAHVALGHRYVHDPHFDYHNLLHLDARLWLGRWALGVGVLGAVDDSNGRGRVEGVYRLLGPAAGPEPAQDGSFLEFVVAGTYHDYRSDGFSTATVETAGRARYDLGRLGDPLRGSFAQAHLGWGLELYDYDLPGVSLGEDGNAMLLAGFGWGVYLGRPGASHGELLLLYDHRRDGYVGGLDGGFAGQVGLAAHWLLAPNEHGRAWGLRAELRQGHATYAGLDVFHRWGPR